MAGTRIDPIPANSFWMEWGYDKVASFKEVSGLDSETEVREVMQSGKDGKMIMIKSQGAQTLKPGKVTAKYAGFKDDPILKWRDEVVKGNMEKARKNVSIVVYSVEDKEVMRFNLAQAWPSKYSWSNLSAKSNEALEITVIIEHEGLTVA